MKLLNSVLLVLLITGCKTSSYEIGSLTERKTLTLGTKTEQYLVPANLTTPVYNADSTIEVARQDGVIVIHTFKKVISTDVKTTRTFANKSIQRGELRNQRDSVAKSLTTTVKLARIEARKGRPSVLDNIRKIIGQFKWILLGLALLVISLIILKVTKWQRSTK